MTKKSAPDGALFVRLPADAVEKLHRAAEVLGMRKKDVVANLVTKYVDPDRPRGLDALRGSYSFQPYDPMPMPEILNAQQAAQFLQIDEAIVLELAEAGKLPGRKLGTAWRFSRAALVHWLAMPGEAMGAKR